jgi:hypothetical protein
MISRRQLLRSSLASATLIAMPAIARASINPPFWSPSNADTASINAAIALAAPTGGDVLCPAGVYSVTGKIIGAPGVHLRGSRKGTIIRLTSMMQDYLIDGGSPKSTAPPPCDGFQVSNMTLDMGAFDPVDDDGNTGGSGAVFIAGNASAAFNLDIIHCGRYGIVSNNLITRNLRIQGNNITRDVPTGASTNIGIMLHGDSRAHPESANYRAFICDNFLSGTPITLMVRDSFVSRNQVIGSKYGAGICFDANVQCTNNLIESNICTDGVGTDYNNTRVSGIECWAVSSALKNNYTARNFGPGLAQVGSDCDIIGHRADSNQSGGIILFDFPGMLAAARCFVDGCRTQGNSLYGFFASASIAPTITMGSNDFR